MYKEQQMAQYSGIYLNLEGTTAEINSLQQPRETAWDTTSGMFRYMDAASGIHYFGGESLWTAYGLSGIYYKVGNDDQVFFGHPEGSYISIESWLVSGAFTLGSNASVTVCGSWWEHRDDDFKIYSVQSGLFRIYNGNNLSFEDPDCPINPKWFLKTSGNNFYIKNGDNNYADLTISSDYRLYLETWSGDMFLRTFNGGNIILQSSGFSSNIKLEATGDVYTTPWQSYSPTISGFSSTPLSRTRYKTVGKLVYVTVEVSGVGDGNGTTISLPYQADTNTNFNFLKVGAGYANTGIWNSYSSSIVRIASGALNADIKIGDTYYGDSGGDVYGSGTTLKYVCGTFWYERA